MAKKQETTPAESPGARASVIHLQGTVAERDWLTAANRKTRLPKATIVRLALAEWGRVNDMPAYPDREDD